ncbi:hypothetical protein [Actinopolymorpha pittospori]|uniref:Uncharacterized protein n=1 Tax=Actinopolymorpha pittospori TaxID=648752 RepID=A0A927N1B9_9ACTN|nr:hypothetical protein [Actinopolymorpha pittospori]MBE1609952.1 hypothetical protein [Actinopolymorpha pittospori]
MSRHNRASRALADAAAVHAAREEIVQALGPLAVSPLDEQATARMRSAGARRVSCGAPGDPSAAAAGGAAPPR